MRFLCALGCRGLDVDDSLRGRQKLTVCRNLCRKVLLRLRARLTNMHEPVKALDDGKTYRPLIRVGLTVLTVLPVLTIGETHRMQVVILVVILGLQQPPTINLVPPPRADDVGTSTPLAYSALLALGRLMLQLLLSRTTLLD